MRLVNTQKLTKIRKSFAISVSFNLWNALPLSCVVVISPASRRILAWLLTVGRAIPRNDAISVLYIPNCLISRSMVSLVGSDKAAALWALFPGLVKRECKDFGGFLVFDWRELTF